MARLELKCCVLAAQLEVQSTTKLAGDAEHVRFQLKGNHMRS